MGLGPISGGGGSGLPLSGGSLTGPVTVAPSSGVNLLNFPLSNAPTWGGFQLSLTNLTPAAGNTYDAGRTVTAGITNTSTTITTSGSSYPNAFSNGDVGRGVTGTGIPASTTIASIPSTTIASGSNNVTLSGSQTISVAAAVASDATFGSTGKLQIHVKDGTYTVVSYTGKSGSTFTGCTGGTGVLITGGTVVCVTSAVLSAAATATNASASLSVGGRSDSPFQWGFNVPGDANYKSQDASLVYSLEPTYTTQGGIRQIEHYISATGENGDSGQLGGNRVYALTISLYDENNIKSTGFATMNLYPNQLVLGHPNNLNDAITFSANADPTLISKLSLANNTVIDIGSTTATDGIIAGGNNVIGYGTAWGGTHTNVAANQTDLQLMPNNGGSGQTVTAYLGKASDGSGIRWNGSTNNMESGRLGTFTPIVGEGRANTLTYAGTASTPAAKFTGAPYIAGSTTTNKPQLLLEDAGTSTNWHANGTYLGINAATGFAGDFIRMQVNGAGQLFYVNSSGQVGMSAFNCSGDGELNSLSIHNTCKIQFSDGNNYNRSFMTSNGALEANTGSAISGTSNAYPIRALTFIPSGTATTCTGATIGTGSKSNAGFVTATTTGVSTIVITFPFTAPTGWSCQPSNNTTSNLIRQSASSTTTATITGTTVSGDVISYVAMAY